MTEDENFYIFENNNRFSKNNYTLEKAIFFNSTLKFCKNCTDCEFCQYCEFCEDCQYCEFCQHCENCFSCLFCLAIAKFKFAKLNKYFIKKETEEKND